MIKVSILFIGIIIVLQRTCAVRKFEWFKKCLRSRWIDMSIPIYHRWYLILIVDIVFKNVFFSNGYFDVNKKCI